MHARQDEIDRIGKQIDEWCGSNPDNFGQILGALRQAAEETAENVSTNWADRPLAAAWRRYARKLDALSAAMPTAI